MAFKTTKENLLLPKSLSFFHRPTCGTSPAGPWMIDSEPSSEYWGWSTWHHWTMEFSTWKSWNCFSTAAICILSYSIYIKMCIAITMLTVANILQDRPGKNIPPDHDLKWVVLWCEFLSFQPGMLHFPALSGSSSIQIWHNSNSSHAEMLSC